MKKIAQLKTILLSLSFILMLVLTACGGGGSGGNGDQEIAQTSQPIGTIAQTRSIVGMAQKGPFVIGSPVTIKELDNDTLELNGITFETQTLDNFGSFVIEDGVTSGYVEITAAGYYFNEITGAISNAPLTLTVLTDGCPHAIVNINMLTTIAAKRIKNLMLEGVNFSEARSQSEVEILNIFGISGEQLWSFSAMDISQPGDSNAILLAVSSILQTNSTVAELSTMLETISTDVETDGTLDDQTVKDQIRNKSMTVNCSTVQTNLQNWYMSLGLIIATIPNLSMFVDSDGDGVINRNDSTPYPVIEPEPTPDPIIPPVIPPTPPVVPPTPDPVPTPDPTPPVDPPTPDPIISTCTITFDVNGGSPVDNGSYVIGTRVQFPYTTKDSPYCFLMGWYDELNVIVDTSSYIAQGDVTLWARWDCLWPSPVPTPNPVPTPDPPDPFLPPEPDPTIHPHWCAAYYRSNGGTPVSWANQEWNTEVVPPFTTNYGCILIGWYDESNIRVDSSYRIKKDMVFTAVWDCSNPIPEPVLPTGLVSTVNDILNSMVTIPAGTFAMGSLEFNGFNPQTTPVHYVTLQSFDMSKYEVTQAQFAKIMGYNPSFFQWSGTENNPVDSVIWYEALEFCAKLSAMTGKEFTLPSEAQWEYVCRAGTTTRYSFGAYSSELSNYAWWNGDAVKYPCSSELCTMPSPVGTKLPNNWGLYDMHGNISEWCLDSRYGNYSNDYTEAPTDGSAWVCSDDNQVNDECQYRIIRGGSFANSLEQVRSATRMAVNPASRPGAFGFRIVEITN